MEFDIGDVVECNDTGFLLLVTGVIHDSEMLYVTDPSGQLNKGEEYGVYFSEVTKQWTLKQS